MESAETVITFFLTALFLTTWTISISTYNKEKSVSRDGPSTAAEWITIFVVPLGSIVFTFYMIAKWISQLITGG